MAAGGSGAGSHERRPTSTRFAALTSKAAQLACRHAEDKNTGEHHAFAAKAHDLAGQRVRCLAIYRARSGCTGCKVTLSRRHGAIIAALQPPLVFVNRHRRFIPPKLAATTSNKMFIVITDHPLRVISRSFVRQPPALIRYEKGQHAKCAPDSGENRDAASCCVCELIMPVLRLPGDREARQEYIYNAHFHREQSKEAAMKLRRGF